jgi:hypothetical protein
MTRLAGCVVFALIVVGLRADEEKVPLDKVPKPVLDAVKKRFPKAKLVEAAKETEGGKTTYEVVIKDGDTNIDIILTPDGKISVIEKTIKEKDLPEAVTKALKAKYSGAKYQKVEEVIKVTDGKETFDFYELQIVTADTKKVEVKIGKDGKIKSDEKEEKKEEEVVSRQWTDDFSADRDTLASTGKNPYFILEPGYQLVLKGGGEEATVTVMNETKTVDGVECRVVEERGWKDGNLDEVSRNYFAISKRTNNVYYFGEDVDEYKNGKVVGHGGSWLSGEKGARFGLMMPGAPLLGARFYQEFAPKSAMDRAEIVGLGLTFNTPAGEFKNCVKIKETTPLEPGKADYKVYAPGIGMVQDGDMKLVKYGKVELAAR